MSSLRRVLIPVGAVVAVLVIGVAIGAVTAVRKPIPDTSGSVTLTGLDGTVTIIRDRHGIANIRADTPEDLFFAQGYVHAQDRFHEMDVRRHVGAGELGELIGPRGAAADRLVRALRLPDSADRDTRLLPTTSRRALDAYARGVNAYTVGKAGSALSLEYTAKSLVGRDYRPDPWAPVDSVRAASLLDWGFAGPVVDELDRILIARHMAPARVGDLYPGFTMANSVASSPVEVPTGSLLRLREALVTIPRITGSPAADGTGAWVRRTAHGDTTVMAEVESAAAIPTPWYQVGLHCTRVTRACPYDVSGLSMAGFPGVVVGHNRSVAWALGEASPPDVRVSIVGRGEKPDGPVLSTLSGGTSLAMTWGRPNRRPSVAGILDMDRGSTVDDVMKAVDELRLPFVIVYATSDGSSGRIPEELEPVRPTRRSTVADLLVPSLLPLTLDSAFAAQGQATLRHWNRRMAAGQPGAAYFAAVWRNVLALTFHDELPKAQWPDGGHRWMVVLRYLLAHPDSTWWDNLATPGVAERRDDILRQAMTQARDELTRLRARDVRHWDWANLHAARLRNPTIDGLLFERGPVPLTGSGDTVERSAWDAAKGYAAEEVAAARLVMNLDRPDASRWICATGVSGHAFSDHYTDQQGPWAGGRTVAWPFTGQAVAQAGVDRLLLSSPAR